MNRKSSSTVEFPLLIANTTIPPPPPPPSTSLLFPTSLKHIAYTLTIDNAAEECDAAAAVLSASTPSVTWTLNTFCATSDFHAKAAQ
jgi:hypothetical protein